jgi:hypothetical protein
VTGLAGVGTDDGVAGFPAGTCVGVAGLFAGDCVPGVIAAEGVVGVTGFAAGVGGGVAGLALPPGAADGAAGVIAAEGVGIDDLAAGVCDGGVLRLARSPAAGVDVAGVTAAEGVVAAGEADVAGVVLPAVVPGTAAADDDGVPGFAAGPCNGAVADCPVEAAVASRRAATMARTLWAVATTATPPDVLGAGSKSSLPRPWGAPAAPQSDLALGSVRATSARRRQIPGPAASSTGEVLSLQKQSRAHFGRLEVDFVTRSSFVTTARALLAITASIRKNPNSATLSRSEM